VGHSVCERNYAVRTGASREIQSSAETGVTTNTGNINTNTSNETSAVSPRSRAAKLFKSGNKRKHDSEKVISNMN
jgi:hypothetical protein